MAITRISNSSLKTLNKSDSFLSGNTAFDPGAYESISTVTVGAGGASTITFSSISSTYKHLQMRILVKDGGGNVPMRFNGDTGNNYANHYINSDGASVSAGALTAHGTLYASLYSPQGVASTFGASVVDILDYANTNKYKTTRFLAGGDVNGGGNVQLVSGLWMNTSAISSIVLTGASNFAQYSSFALYGIKG
jgi:hypothetical protein